MISLLLLLLLSLLLLFFEGLWVADGAKLPRDRDAAPTLAVRGDLVVVAEDNLIL